MVAKAVGHPLNTLDPTVCAIEIAGGQESCCPAISREILGEPKNCSAKLGPPFESAKAMPPLQSDRIPAEHVGRDIKWQVAGAQRRDGVATNAFE